jgi:hypothetical protein
MGVPSPTRSCGLGESRAKLASLRPLIVLLWLAACHDDSGAPANVSASASVDDLTPGCVAAASTRFDDSFAFEPAVPNTLADWTADGRWFLTGTAIPGTSSLLFDRAGDDLRLDRDASSTVTVNPSEIFARRVVGKDSFVAYRLSNQRPDGTLRAERAACLDGQCTVCTALLIRATHFHGESQGDGLTLLGQLDDPTWGRGYTFNVRVAGTIAYLIRQDGLHMIETADPTHPIELGHYARAAVGYSNDVKLVDAGGRRYALIADTPIDVVDVTDPAAPVLAATIAESSHTLFTETRDGKTLAYLGNYDGRCAVYDVTDPRLPIWVASFATNASILHDLSVDGGIAYLNAWEQGFFVVDFTSLAAPRQLGVWAPTPIRASHSNWTATVAGRHIALHGEEGYDAHLDIVDVDPASPSFMTSIASWQTRPWISIHNLMAFGHKAYLTHYQDGVRVLDLSDPTQPAQLGYYNTWDPAADYATSAFFEGAVGLDVDLARKLVFVADSPRGLLILADTTP